MEQSNETWNIENKKIEGDEEGNRKEELNKTKIENREGETVTGRE